MRIEFVELTESDLELVKKIYDYYIENSTATYYTEKITIAELKEFIPVQHKKYKSFLSAYPWLFAYVSIAAT